jgi:hypothetical protein
MSATNWQVGDLVKVKSGKIYRIQRLRGPALYGRTSGLTTRRTFATASPTGRAG